MKKLLWFGMALIVFAAAGSASAQNPPSQQTITLYGPQHYDHDFSRASVDLERAAYAPARNFGDLGYGLLRVGTDGDWLHISNAGDHRTVIRDLGQHAWTDSFTVPWVEPLARLKSGERRQVFVSTKGKDGAGSAGGYEGLSALPSTDGPGAGSTYVPNPRPRPPKGDGETQTSPNILKAVLNHIYVIHVVDDQRDFYALVRIDSLQSSDNCTISWKMIPPPPQSQAPTRKK